MEAGGWNHGHLRHSAYLNSEDELRRAAMAYGLELSHLDKA
jgi:hypothetical protein